MNRTALLLLAVALPALALSATNVMAQSNGTSGSERPVAGAFTDSQAVTGETVFKATCGACHTPTDHYGPQFKLNWFGRTVWEYFISLKKTMPDDNPGGLSDDEYTAVVAYILKLNGYPGGSDLLSADSVSLKLIKIGPLPGDSTKPRSRR